MVGVDLPPSCSGVPDALYRTVGFLIAVRADMLTQELPDIKSLFTLQNLVLLSLAAVVVKAIHELGHALTCQHYGGECHELGVLMVLFFPLLYCDVSDSWTMTSRWKRIAVSSAGIVAELAIAAVCGLLWMCSFPGALHSFFLKSHDSVFSQYGPCQWKSAAALRWLLCVVGFAANSELIERKQDCCRWMDESCVVWDRWNSFRIQSAGTAMLAMWGLASAAYRTAISVTLLIVLYQMLQPLGLEALSLIPVFLLGRTHRDEHCEVADHRCSHCASANQGDGRCSSGGVDFVCDPADTDVTAREIHMPAHTGKRCSHFVRVPGHIQAHVESEQPIQSGQLVAELRNPELELQFAALRGEVRLKEVQVSNLETNRTREPSLAAAYTLPFNRWSQLDRVCRRWSCC